MFRVELCATYRIASLTYDSQRNAKISVDVRVDTVRKQNIYGSLTKASPIAPRSTSKRGKPDKVNMNFAVLLGEEVGIDRFWNYLLRHASGISVSLLLN